MDWLDWIDFLGKTLKGNRDLDARTPLTFPTTDIGQGGQPGGQQQQSSFDWVPWAAQTGLGVLGTGLQARAQGNQNEAFRERTQSMDRLAREEQARREYYSSILLPSLLQSIGNRSPGILGMAMQRQTQLPGFGGQPPQQNVVSNQSPVSYSGGSGGEDDYIGREADPFRQRGGVDIFGQLYTDKREF